MLRTQSSNHSKEGETLNGRLIAEWRTRQTAERPTEDGEPDGGRNAQRKTDSLTENREPDGGRDARRKAESPTEGGTLNGGRNAQRTTDRRI